MRIFPAHILKGFDGAAYLRDYNFKLMPGTGPYTVAEADIKKGTRCRCAGDKTTGPRSIAPTSDKFSMIRNIVVRDRNLAFEMFKKGELDVHFREHLSTLGRGVELKTSSAG